MSERDVERRLILSPAILRAGIVVLWAVWLAWLLVGKKYEAFINLAYWPLVVGALVMVVGFAAALFSRGRSTQASAGSGGLARRMKAAVFVLMLPLVFAPLGESGRLGGFAFNKRFVNVPGGKADMGTAESTPVTETAPAPAARAAVVPATISQIAESPEKYVNKRVVFEGMVHRDADVGQGQAWVYRYLVTCCAADAQPMALKVEARDPAMGLDGIEAGLWVRVEGVYRQTKNAMGMSDCIYASAVTVIPPLAKPYLYYVPPSE